jgi:DNA processing protein
LDLVRSLGLAVLTLDDPAYPARLRSVEMPPPLLFVMGSIESLDRPHAVAVVGTRRATDKGRLVAGWIAAGLARSGAVVVSGLAVGIDGAAHAAVVCESHATVAVLGSGHARLFPRAHERLADAIAAAGGAVVSELPPETAASRGTFPRRNRVVSGLSDAVVVIEAGERSGALITAGWALEQGRECFLVPGGIDDPASSGCNAFLRAFPGQARVVCGVPELIEDIGLGCRADLCRVGGDWRGRSSIGGVAGSRAAGWSAPEEPGAALPDADWSACTENSPSVPCGVAPRAWLGAILASLGPVEQQLAALVAAGPATADDLSRMGDLPAAAVLSALTLLELRGLVSNSFGRYVPAGALARAPLPARGKLRP